MGELDRTYGAVLIGAFISAVLFGITNLQTFVYFQKYPSDRIWNKISVCWLWMLDAAHLVLCIHLVYWYLVTNYLDPLVLLDIVWSFKAQIIVDAIVIVSVHTLYTIRLWKLNAADNRKSALRKLLPLAVSAIVLFGGYGSAITLCYEILQFESYTGLLESRWVTYLPLGAATFIDVIIALSLCYFLERCRVGSTSMDSTITVLMLYTLNTGVITSLCSLTAIITMTALPTTFAVISVEFMLTKLYVNSFLAMFNARNKLRMQSSIVDAEGALVHPYPLASESSARSRDHKAAAGAFSFSPTNSTGHSDLRASLRPDRAPALDVDIEHGLSIHFVGGSCEDRQSDVVPRTPAQTVVRVMGRRASAPLDGAEPYTQFGRAHVPRRSAYDVFATRTRGSSLLRDVDEVWPGNGSQTWMQMEYGLRAQTPSELIGMAVTKDA